MLVENQFASTKKRKGGIPSKKFLTGKVRNIIRKHKCPISEKIRG